MDKKCRKFAEWMIDKDYIIAAPLVDVNTLETSGKRKRR